MNTYEVTVIRNGKKGTLKFQHGDITVNTTCWWDLDKVIMPGTYAGCSATKMNRKKRDAIYFPGKVPKVGGGTMQGIFIHKGTSAGWSDGCIVIAGDQIKKMWNAINPSDAKNVTVIISDKSS